MVAHLADWIAVSSPFSPGAKWRVYGIARRARLQSTHEVCDPLSPTYEWLWCTPRRLLTTPNLFQGSVAHEDDDARPIAVLVNGVELGDGGR